MAMINITTTNTTNLFRGTIVKNPNLKTITSMEKGKIKIKTQLLNFKAKKDNLILLHQEQFTSGNGLVNIDTA